MKAAAEKTSAEKAVAEAEKAKAPSPAPAPKEAPAVIKNTEAKGIGVVQGGEVGGRVLPKEDIDPEILNFLKVS
jgi:hypothetical protein